MKAKSSKTTEKVQLKCYEYAIYAEYDERRFDPSRFDDNGDPTDGKFRIGTLITNQTYIHQSLVSEKEIEKEFREMFKKKVTLIKI